MVGATLLQSVIDLNIYEHIPLYKQFDWVPCHASVIYRIESFHGHPSTVCIPIIVKSQKLPLRGDINTDYTTETIAGLVNVTYDINRFGDYITKERHHKNYIQTYYTNEVLLNEAKKLGFTHIYRFMSSRQSIWQPYDEPLPYRNYFVCGVKKPEYKTVNGKLQIIEINHES